MNAKPRVSARDSAPERRRRLRALDIALGEELDDAGALSFLELRSHVAERELLGRQVSDATLWEWWSYAHRRSFIEPRGLVGHDVFALTEAARNDVADRRLRSSLKVTPAMRKTLREATPAGWMSLVIATVALALTSSTAQAVLVLIASVVVVALVLSPAVDLLLGRRADTCLDRRILDHKVSWLEGDALKRWLWRAPQPPVNTEEMRRLTSPPLPDRLR